MKKIIIQAAVMLVFAFTATAQSKEEAIRKTLNERYESAETDLQTLISRELSNGDLYHAAGDNYLYWGELEQAEEMYRKGISSAPANPLNYAGLGRVSWINKNEAVTVAQFAKAIEIMGARSNKVPKPTQQLTYMKMAEVYLQSEVKNLEKALEYINAALLLDENNAEVYILLGDYYGEMDGSNLSRAVMEYNKAIEKDPKSSRAILRKGMLYVKIRNYDEGLNYFNEAIALDPTFAPAYREKAELLYKALKYDLAIEAYAKYLELNNSCRVQQRYASFIFLTKDYARAIKEMEKALPCNPQNVIMYRLLGYAYYETNNVAKGVENMDKFFTMATAKGKPTIVGEDYGYRGKLLAKSGQDSLAIIMLQEAMSKDSTYVNGYSDIGNIYLKQKKYAEAARYYRMKIANSETPEALDYYYLGTSSYFNKEFAAADSAFSMAEGKYPDASFWRGRANNRMEVDPNAPTGLGKPYYEAFIQKVSIDQKAIEANKKNLIESYSYLGQFYTTLNNYDCAKVAFTKVIELDPENANAKIALEDKNVIEAAGTCELIPGLTPIVPEAPQTPETPETPEKN